jgi:SIR2-like domain
MTVVLTASQILAKLADFKPAESIAWLGAGLSRPHYPGWAELIKKLCGDCGVNYPTTSADLLQLADECQKKSDPYDKSLKKIFAAPITKMDPRYLALLNTQFLAYITTNFDPLLEHHIPQKKTVDRFAYPDLLASRVRPKTQAIFHIHGSIRCPAGLPTQHSTEFLVLSKTDFGRAYSSSSLLPGFLTQIFRLYPILFMGYSLAD